MKTDGWRKELVDVIVGIKNRQELSTFLDGILTQGEIVEISRRLQIVKMLKRGIAQHEIAEKLGVGVATVTRGSKEIQKGNFHQIYETE
ncbi:MAG: YerC/YecD family TrpR-related protein [Patescibacteria group bacterium]